MSGAYYKNSLHSWRLLLMRDLRQARARYTTMVRQGHPDRMDQGRLIEIKGQFLETVNAALADLTTRPDANTQER